MCHVLIIEDEPLIALDLEELLGRYGALTFSFADSQRGAIDASRDIRPDFILSDVSLLEGTGPLAVQAIRCELGVIPVTGLSQADGQTSDRRRLSQDGVRRLTFQLPHQGHRECEARLVLVRRYVQ